MDTTIMPDTLWRAERVAQLLDIPVPRVYALVREDRIPHVRIHRRVRFLPGQIEDWLRQGGTGYTPNEAA